MRARLATAITAVSALAILLAGGCRTAGYEAGSGSDPASQSQFEAQQPTEAQGMGAKGRPVADFTVERVNGSGSFTLSEARGDWVVLHFLLKTECPICRRTTDTYASRGDEVPGIRQVFLKPDAPEDTRTWIEGFSNPKDVAPIYRDPDARLAERFNIPDGYEFHGEVVHYPALIVINPDGEEVFRYVGERTQDRYPFDRFKQKMASLKAEYERSASASAG